MHTGIYDKNWNAHLHDWGASLVTVGNKYVYIVHGVHINSVWHNSRTSSGVETASHTCPINLVNTCPVN